MGEVKEHWHWKVTIGKKLAELVKYTEINIQLVTQLEKTKLITLCEKEYLNCSGTSHFDRAIILFANVASKLNDEQFQQFKKALEGSGNTRSLNILNHVVENIQGDSEISKSFIPPRKSRSINDTTVTSPKKKRTFRWFSRSVNKVVPSTPDVNNNSGCSTDKEGTFTKTEDLTAPPELLTIDSTSSEALTKRRILKALFPCFPEHEDELHMEIGDEIEFIEEVEDGWWRGKLKGRVGVFPSNYVVEVKAVEKSSNETSGISKVWIVEYDYPALESDELSLKKGDVITNVVTKWEGWCEGTLGGRIGLFPENFGKPIGNPVDETSSLRLIPGRRRLKVLFSYAPEEDDELRLEFGDEIDFLAEVEEGWWRGKLKGRVGVFPSNFVMDVGASGKVNIINPDDS